MDFTQALQRGLQHHQANQLAQAEAWYRQILTTDPNQPDALHLLGVVAHQSGQNAVAIDLIQRAIQLQPQRPEFYNNLGAALRSSGDRENAMKAFEQAASMKADYLDPRRNAADLLAEVGIQRLDEGKPEWAEEICRAAIAVLPTYAVAHHNLGIVLRRARKIDEAIAEFDEAIRLQPDLAEAHSNRGNSLRERGQMEQAMDAYRRAIELRPRATLPHSNLIFAMNYRPQIDQQALADELEHFRRQHAAVAEKLVRNHPNDKNPDRRLKIGYVSAHIREHVIGRNLYPLLMHHDHEAFEIFCYSNSAGTDALGGKMQKFADVWRPVLQMSDDQLAAQIREDQIDILVDLTLHVEGNRLLTFAQKPAPVQATFMGYPGSTGLKTIDYRLTDPQLDPPGLNDAFYSEESIRLPHSFWCYDPIETEVEVSPLPADASGKITFGSLCDFSKVHDTTLQLWARVLKRLPTSDLLMLAPPGFARESVIHRLGIDPSRVRFVDRQDRNGYMRQFQQIDIALDTYPYGAHTTGLDGWWMGVPCISLAGQPAVSRAGLSHATQLGLTDLVATSPEQFVEIAVALANDLPRLRELRSTLRDRMQKSPLMDGASFARDIEAVYRSMWRTWCKK